MTANTVPLVAAIFIIISWQTVAIGKQLLGTASTLPDSKASKYAKYFMAIGCCEACIK